MAAFHVAAGDQTQVLTGALYQLSYLHSFMHVCMYICMYVYTNHISDNSSIQTINSIVFFLAYPQSGK